MPLLNVENLTVTLKRQGKEWPVIKGIHFEIHPGEIFALVGESGSGKTLTALSIMQLLPHVTTIIPPSRILLNGNNLVGYSEVEMHKIRGGRIGMIFQEPMTSLNPVFTIGYQIIEVLRAHQNLSKKAEFERVLELLEQVDLPNPHHIYECYPHQLSGGMKQRAMIAMALAGDPELLIADEPTSALDVLTQADILQLLKKLQAKNHMAILMITHDLAVVHEFADQVAIMRAGEIVETNSTEAFFKSPEHPYSQKLFASLPSLAKRGSYLSTEAEKTDSERLFPKAIATSELPVLTVENLKVYFPIHKGLFKRTVGFIKAIDGVSFSLQAGKTLAIVGESGSGKTTLGRALIQLIEPTEGQINVADITMPTHSHQALKKMRQTAQIIFQDPFSSMNPRMRVGEIIAEGMVILNNIRDEKILEKRVSELLTQVNLPIESKDLYPHEFSGGQRQRISIARALAVNPQIVICDEPTSALDVTIQAQILNLLKKLQLEQNLSYVFITHNFAVVSYIADDVLVLHEGKVVEYGDVESVIQHPKHPYTRSLLEAIPAV